MSGAESSSGWVHAQMFDEQKSVSYRYATGEVALTTTVNDDFLLEVRESQVQVQMPAGMVVGREMTDMLMIRVVPRGLWVLRVNSLLGVQSYVWKVGKARASELLDMYGSDCLAMSDEEASAGVEVMPCEELYLAPQDRVGAVDPKVAAQKAFAKALAETQFEPS